MSDADYYRELVEAAGLGQREAARAIGMGEGRFREALRGKRKLSTTQLLALERVALPDEVYMLALKGTEALTTEGQPKHRPRVLTKAQLDELKALYKAGKTYDELAVMLGVSRATVARRIRELKRLGWVWWRN